VIEAMAEAFSRFRHIHNQNNTGSNRKNMLEVPV